MLLGFLLSCGGDVQKCVCESVRAHTRSSSHRQSRIHLTWCFLSHIPKATSYLAENDTRYNNLCIFSSRALCIYSFLNLILFFLRAHSLLSAFFCTLLVFRCGANHLLYAFLLKTKKSSENGRESNSSKKIRTKFIVCTSSISMICCCCFLYAMHFTAHTQLNTTKLSLAWTAFFDALWWWLKSSGFFLVWSVHSRANVAFNMNMDMRIDFHSFIHYFRMHLTLSHFNKYFLHLLNSSHNNSGSNVRKCFNVILFCIVVWRLTLDVGCCSTYIHK